MSFQIAGEILERDRREETEDREPPMTASEIANAAEDRLMASMEEFTNWAAGKCYGRAGSPEHCRIGYVPSGLGLHAMVESFDVGQLLASILHPNRELVFAAAQRLGEVFKAENADLIAKYCVEAQQ